MRNILFTDCNSTGWAVTIPKTNKYTVMLSHSNTKDNVLIIREIS